MAIVSAITAAVAAVASITLSQVAIAATVVGTALSVAGSVTGNKTLKYVGMGIGIAGGLTSLAGAAGFFDPTQTLGSVFGGGAGADALGNSLATTATSAGSNVVPAAAPAATAQAAASPITGTASVATDQFGSQIGDFASNVGGEVASKGAKAVGDAAAAAGSQITPAAQSVSGAFAPPGFQQTPQGLVHVGSTTPVAESGAPFVAAPTAPAGPTGAVAPPGPTGPTGGIAPTVAAGGSVTEALGGLRGSIDPSKVSNPGLFSNVTDWWKSLDPATKTSFALMGGQAAAGMLGGVFTAMSAQQRLDLEQLINDQRNAIEQTKLARATSGHGMLSYRGGQPL